MVASIGAKHLTPRAVAVGLIFAGLLAGGTVALMPQDLLDALSWRLWLPYVVGAAMPPVGMTGRALLAIGIAGVFAVPGAALWWRTRAPGATSSDAAVPVLRRADAHPDAPARRPIRATEDLGPPLPIAAVPSTARVPEPERPLPADLDQPLATFDPDAVPAAPREPVRAVPSLAPRPALIDPGERFETFELTPIRRASPELRPEPETEPAPVTTATPEPALVASIGALLDRLEKTRPPRQASAPASLDETLSSLRRLAVG